MVTGLAERKYCIYEKKKTRRVLETRNMIELKKKLQDKTEDILQKLEKKKWKNGWKRRKLYTKIINRCSRKGEERIQRGENQRHS